MKMRDLRLLQKRRPISIPDSIEVGFFTRHFDVVVREVEKGRTIKIEKEGVAVAALVPPTTEVKELIRKKKLSKTSSKQTTKIA